MKLFSYRTSYESKLLTKSKQDKFPVKNKIIFLADFYSFDSSKYVIGEFFGDLKTFSLQFQVCLEDNLKIKETEEKIKRAEEEREKREKEKQARKTHKEKLMQSTTTGGEMGDTGVMDNLLEALQSGKLFEASSGGPSKQARRPVNRDRLQGNFIFYHLVFINLEICLI